MPDVILVTGGSGLVGAAIQHVIETEPEGSRFGKRAGETWVFARSGDGDLRYASCFWPKGSALAEARTGMRQQPRLSLLSTSPLMSSILLPSVRSLTVMLLPI
jgi:hypothetical protein